MKTDAATLTQWKKLFYKGVKIEFTWGTPARWQPLSHWNLDEFPDYEFHFRLVDSAQANTNDQLQARIFVLEQQIKTLKNDLETIRFTAAEALKWKI